MNGYTPKKLAEALVEKHDRLMCEYSDEVEKVQQITMLREKADQLKHWAADAGANSKFAKELAEADKELTQLQSSFKPKSQTHYAGIKEKIEEHKKAKEYWLGRIGEMKA
jgi:hypothetical protein